jgi:hypothetical protein
MADPVSIKFRVPGTDFSRYQIVADRYGEIRIECAACETAIVHYCASPDVPPTLDLMVDTAFKHEAVRHLAPAEETRT